MIMSLGATKVRRWLQRNTSSMMVLVEHYTNRTKLNDILKRLPLQMLVILQKVIMILGI